MYLVIVYIVYVLIILWNVIMFVLKNKPNDSFIDVKSITMAANGNVTYSIFIHCNTDYK